MSKPAGPLTNQIEDLPPHFTGGRLERLERGRSVVLLAQPTHCPRHHGTVAASRRCLRFAAERTLIVVIERIRAGRFGKADFSLTFAPEINTDIPVPVDILDEEPINADAALVAESYLHYKSSHSFFVPAA